MLKREVRRKIRTTATTSGLLFVALLIIAFGFFSYKDLLPRLAIRDSQDKIVKPFGVSITIQDLSKKLADKNLIMDSLAVSSMSGVFVGVVRGGPTVYFSENHDASWQVDLLVLIITRTMVDNKKPTYIDLRNGRPIVKFSSI